MMTILCFEVKEAAIDGELRCDHGHNCQGIGTFLDSFCRGGCEHQQHALPHSSQQLGIKETFQVFRE